MNECIVLLLFIIVNVAVGYVTLVLFKRHIDIKYSPDLKDRYYIAFPKDFPENKQGVLLQKLIKLNFPIVPESKRIDYIVMRLKMLDFPVGSIVSYKNEKRILS